MSGKRWERERSRLARHGFMGGMETRRTGTARHVVAGGEGIRRPRAWALVVGGILAMCGAALATAPALAGQQTRVLLVAGLGGTPEYRKEFHDLVQRLDSALVNRLRVDAANVTLLEENPVSASDHAEQRSTRDNVMSALAALAASAGPSDDILVVLLGHGTAEGDDVRFNLPGPDLTPADLATALDAFKTQHVAVVNAASASGGFVAPLAAPNRVVVAATRTSRERSATVFPRYFVDALAGDGADLDKDGRVSILEAFQYARQETERHYKDENLLQVEHAVLDDNGDGEGSMVAAADSADGKLASEFRLGIPGDAAVGATPTTDDPVLKRLYAERTEIQKKIDDLRARKESMPPEEYQEQLENLLVELGLKNREIRQHGGGG
ncbi:MAG: C13 family peptidase [Gemmatimonadetes bacterium]|nr:C13 family peptidase [Gemmatimonadota bacterium]